MLIYSPFLNRLTSSLINRTLLSYHENPSVLFILVIAKGKKKMLRHKIAVRYDFAMHKLKMLRDRIADRFDSNQRRAKKLRDKRADRVLIS